MTYLTPEELLALWQKWHGALKKEWQDQFLLKPQVRQILQFTSDFVIPAVRGNEKLVDILFVLVESEKKGSDVKRLTKSAHNDKPVIDQSKSKKHSPPQRTARLSRQAAGPTGKVPRFDEGHPSEYGSTTLRKPGRVEAILPGREQCPSCGMVVTGNNSKCRCG